MTTFLTYIGWYNLLGPVLLFALQSERIADLVLRRGTEIIAQPYEHGPYGRLWLWWTAGANGALGFVMVRAVEWPRAAQNDVVAAALFVYAVLWLAMGIGARPPRYGRGVWATHGLWAGQIGWGLYVLAT
jgi:hypothetical protein